ncbi:transcriptional regulator [Longispora fulva]|uniref:Lrp/AsnC family transcriptional regulator n=1 Tax=Longispora TaxID=203522 RepID=UPI0018C9F951|nr:Lrp/AsnC family transcriptional regulator [Longispora fulva]GIG61610.1 transcriptional regulator [Longispora fulva]
MTENPVLDDVNKRLVELLQRDGRTSYAALAKLVGLSEAAVRQRVQRMLDTNVMQIVAVTDPLTLGFARQVMIGIKVTGDLKAAADTIALIPEVDYVVICAGGYDLLVELVCADDEHLLTLLNDAIRTVPGVTATETFVYLKLTKQTYAWGTR